MWTWRLNSINRITAYPSLLLPSLWDIFLQGVIFSLTVPNTPCMKNAPSTIVTVLQNTTLADMPYATLLSA